MASKKHQVDIALGAVNNENMRCLSVTNCWIYSLDDVQFFVSDFFVAIPLYG